MLRATGWYQGSFTLEQTWPDGNTRPPQTEVECRVTLQRLIDTCFDGIEAARDFVDSQALMYREAAEIEQRAQRALQAQQILEHYERTTQLNDRVDRSVTRALDSYRQLILDRPNDGDGADIETSRNEPNPII